VFREGNSWTNETLDSIVSNTSGPDNIAVARDARGYHVLYSTGNKEVFYAHQALAAEPGDYDRNGRVNGEDYVAWKAAFGLNASGDGDRDGDTDGADFLLWQRHLHVTPEPETPIVTNGDFEAGGMASWTTIITPNGSLSSGFPRVETFDVDGDGELSSAMRIRVGQITFNNSVPAGAGIEQVINVPVAGDYLLSADIASTNIDITGNTSPGRFELILDGIMLDVVDFTNMVINPNQVLRDSLSAEIQNLARGAHTLRVMVVRPGTNTRQIYQYVDDISLTPLAAVTASQHAVPEPCSLVLLASVAGLAAARLARAS
jgi:hypothetical protein